MTAKEFCFVMNIICTVCMIAFRHLYKCNTCYFVLHHFNLNITNFEIKIINANAIDMMPHRYSIAFK